MLKSIGIQRFVVDIYPNNDGHKYQLQKRPPPWQQIYRQKRKQPILPNYIVPCLMILHGMPANERKPNQDRNEDGPSYPGFVFFSDRIDRHELRYA